MLLAFLSTFAVSSRQKVDISLGWRHHLGNVEAACPNPAAAFPTNFSGVECVGMYKSSTPSFRCVCVCVCVSLGGMERHVSVNAVRSRPIGPFRLRLFSFCFFPHFHTLLYSTYLIFIRPSAVRIWQPIPHALRCCVLRGPDVFVRGCDLPFFLTPAVSSRNRFPLAMHAIL